MQLAFNTSADNVYQSPSRSGWTDLGINPTIDESLFTVKSALTPYKAKASCRCLVLLGEDTMSHLAMLVRM